MNSIIKNLTLAALIWVASLNNGTAADGLEYLNEICWQAQSNSPEQQTGILKLGVLRFGAGHFPLYGRISSPDFGDVIVNGNAELTSKGIEAALQGMSFEGQTRQGWMIHLLLDGSLNGSFRIISFESEGGQQFETITDEGVLTQASCP